MRTFRFLQVATLSVLVGGAALAYAQDAKQDDKPARQEEAKPEPKQDEAKPPKEEMKQDQKEQATPERQDHPAMQNDHAVQGQDHPAPQAAHAQPAGKGGHIPDDKFKAHFGHSHTFTAKTVIVQGQPQFSYGGYSFQLVDAWPADWAWTDQCYIDYIDGEYFLFDLLHPGVRIAVFVVM